LQADNAATLKALVKAPDVGFFPIEYGFQPGGMDVPSEVNSTPTSFFSERMRMKSLWLRQRPMTTVASQEPGD
ncbi:MAG TPA: hypothetical protein VF464_07920, partial [Candidatus Methylomirabilis sp.]